MEILLKVSPLPAGSNMQDFVLQGIGKKDTVRCLIFYCQEL